MTREQMNQLHMWHNLRRVRTISRSCLAASFLFNGATRLWKNGTPVLRSNVISSGISTGHTRLNSIWSNVFNGLFGSHIYFLILANAFFCDNFSLFIYFLTFLILSNFKGFLASKGLISQHVTNFIFCTHVYIGQNQIKNNMHIVLSLLVFVLRWGTRV